VYAIIYNLLSIEGEEVLAKDKNWNPIKRARDLFHLWKLIKKTRMVSTDGDLKAMKAQARDVNCGCKQFAIESISN